jgi:hypothetical protein
MSPRHEHTCAQALYVHGRPRLTLHPILIPARDKRVVGRGRQPKYAEFASCSTFADIAMLRSSTAVIWSALPLPAPSSCMSSK